MKFTAIIFFCVSFTFFPCLGQEPSAGIGSVEPPNGEVEGNAIPDPSGDYYDWTKTRQPERPYIHASDQTLVMKIFLSEKEPNEGSKVDLTFYQALEVIRKLDNLTCGMPKIVYLVGWQHNGNDSMEPDWSEVTRG